jgi:hypothetical protein
VTQESRLGLLDFVRQLPEGYAYAPIYLKGAELPDGGVSKGKTPLGRAHHQVMGPADVALQIERAPEVFKAVGVFTGPRSRGLVILDVDANLAKLRRKWGESLDGAPMVTSTKRNAAKFLFRVAEDLWSQVKGVSLAATGAGYEVLWGRQGLLYGAYPGSSDGKAPEGLYGFEGDLEAIPEAPAWLVAEMRDAATQSEPVGGFLKNRRALDFSDRTEDEIAEIAQDCLRVIPHLGSGSRDQWIQVGMAIHDGLPNDLGLTLWSAWSAEDPEYAAEWKDGNPCEAPWGTFKRGGGIRFNSLIWMADQQDPQRRRFSDSSRVAVEEVEGQKVQRVRSASLTHHEIVQRAMRAMELPNPSEAQHMLHEIALEAGYRDSAAIVRLLIADQEYRRGCHGGELKEIFAQEDSAIGYLIPDLLPNPGTVLIHGRGGCGKTMAVMTLAKHIARGLPFSVRGDFVPVEQGPVLWLNGDQNSRRIKKQFEELEFRADDPVIVQNKVSMLWYPWFIKQIELHRPRLVVWDSVTACMRGCAHDQNKAEYAEPLYWYSAENGESFPATTIVFIHHANKEGGFRGTTALEDGVDESWAIQKPEERDRQRLGAGARIITIKKSREGNEDKQLILRQQADLTFDLRDLPPAEDQEEANAPASVIDRVLQRLRVHQEPMTKAELVADPLVGGNVAAIRKALQRLEDRGLITSEGRGSSKRYEALLARTGVPGKTCPKTADPSNGAGSAAETCLNLSQTVPSCPKSDKPTGSAASKRGKLGQGGTKRDSLGQPKGVDPLQRNESADLGQPEAPLFTREGDDAVPDSPVTVLERGDVIDAGIKAIDQLLAKEPPCVIDVVAQATEVWD